MSWGRDSRNGVKKSSASLSYSQGLQAEEYVAQRLIAQGYRILNRRYRTPYGELDLVACDNHDANTLIIIEVKKRSSTAQALQSLSPKQQKRIQNAALIALEHYHEYLYVRIDLCAIDTFHRLVHVKNISLDFSATS